ncbi:EscV/YscV/HrcV family type III secretion system export apparatus protein [Paramagnetospirillum marisnigri]|uniref:Flagellar biosynthesis protein FlhA n=1 Tax=Paramagnetospirillum marisnigri TaxID=1285242 RepID=A0A178MU93_9PROT|nr:flagellar biosynthesis protein FlhA [Paramagnetospirillum marisnigri]OAN52334.1 EscV/YscV/HrcV family type III secretion system export apparatus protein [Paramagnetospirillum marisnigri]
MAEGGASDGQVAARQFFDRMGAAARRGDVGFAVGIIMILMVLILPLPAWALDVGLALSLTMSVLILMVSIFIEKPLQFSSYPTVLLITTLIRLSLNLASTRLILSHGHEGVDGAGKVIAAFASFIMSGNFVIGIIVFAILVIVNFVVITKGSGRIAEVAARFNLDAMPGKQMAIDADLSAGLIDEPTARKRRSELEQESAFFGSMDGASKFVRGDAVAGLLITSINIIGGMIIGMAQNGLTFSQAADIYTKLTVGEGLVTQVPALIVSVSAGMLVTKAGVPDSMDKALFNQLAGYPRAVGMAGALMGMMALVPSMPFVPFALLGCGMGAAAYFLDKHQRTKAEEEAHKESAQAMQQAPVAEEPISTALRIDHVRLELGYGLLQLINNPKGQRLTDQIKSLRRAVAGEMGFVMPSVRIQDNMQLPANTYVVFIKDVEAGRGDLRPNMLLIMDPRGEEITLPGEKTREPTFGLPAMWIDSGVREEALFRGYTVVDPPTVITTHLTEVIKDNMSELLSHAETQKLLDELDKEHQKLVTELIPSQMTVGGLQRVLQNLLGERVSIRDLPTILEGIAEACGHTRNVTMITEHVRARLARQISDGNTGHQGFIPLVTLSPEWEQAFAESLVGSGEEKQISMAPSQLQDFINRVRQTFERFAMQGETPILLTSPVVRPYVRSIIERFRPMTVVMSQSEIHPKARIKTLGQI